MSPMLIILFPFAAALLIGGLARFGRNIAALIAGAGTVAGLGAVIGLMPAVARGPVMAGIAWLPAYGLNIHLMLDSLGQVFALLILGMGLLIIIYARFYMAGSLGRFYALLMLFQGAMLGMVLSDNILLLLIFWELTALTSFLLIGYWSDLAGARQGARMALAVTGAGGLALFAGLLLLGQVAGSYDLSVILGQGAVIQSSPLYLPILVLILLGAFTKSAQVPFHGWLPAAMAAPTPVSAYLHSATMVKAGLFLMARLWPVLAGTEAWFYIITTTGLLTMIYAAKQALVQDDIKATLAYSTISHLGLITFLLGLGSREGLVAALFHILCHASFKAALFMVAGIMDHATNSRDFRKMGGLARVMPWTFGMAAVACLAMAGLPPLNGYLSKEMALAAAAQTVWGGNPWVVPVLASVGAALSVAYSLRFLGAGFLGVAKWQDGVAPRDPGWGLLIAPLILILAVIGMGLWPMILAAPLIPGVQIVPWHGWHSLALWMSLFAWAVAGVVLSQYPLLRRLSGSNGWAVFESILAGVTVLARPVLGRSILPALLVILLGALYGFFSGDHAPGLRAPLPANALTVVLTAVLILSVGAALGRGRLTALIFVGVVGLVIALGFALLAAPDLALTQILVEVVTLILMLHALAVLPKTSPAQGNWFNGAVALAVGAAMAALAWALMTRDPAFAPMSIFHLAQSLPGAGGANAVNTIIVDFRGFDTFGEIIVLAIAALIVAGLGGRDTQVPQPMMLTVMVRFLGPIFLALAVFLYLRGHNLPGGGFVAGLVLAIGFILQDIIGGRRVAAQRVMGLGILIAAATGMGSFLLGRPFLTSAHGDVPVVWATASLFDLGVFLTVFGAVMLVLTHLAAKGRG